MPDEAQQQPAETTSGNGDWTPPASQEELNRIIAARVSREREKFADYDDIKSKAAKFDEVEEAAKSELEKALARAEAAESAVQQFETQKQINSWKSDVAEKTGVPAAALSGSTLEEITAHASVLAPLIKQPGKGPIVPNAGDTPNQMALNGDGIEQSLRSALHIH